MTRKFSSMMLGLAVFALPALAQAGLTDNLDTTGLINKIKFTNYEVFVRGDADEWEFLGAGETPVTGDHLISVFSASELTIQNAPDSGVFGPVPAWQKGDDYFLGYSVAMVTTDDFDLDYSNPLFDPFGRLEEGEMVALYDSTTDWVIEGVDIEADVTASFANATEWATFGIEDGTPNGGGFTALPPIFGTLIGVSAIGLNAVDGPAGWPGFDKDKAFQNDIFAGSNIYLPGEGAWTARSEDPLTFAAVPEPGTLALWGGCLAIGAVVALRRRKS